MNEKNENTLIKTTMTYGLYVGIAFSIVVLLFKLAGRVYTPGDNSGLFNTVILSFAMFYYGRRHQRLYFSEGISYGKAFGFTIMLAVFSSIIFAFFAYWYYGVIEPEALQAFLNQIEFAVSESFNFPEGQQQALIDLYRSSLTPATMAFAIFFKQVLNGAFLALVVSYFLKTPLHLNFNKHR